MIQDIKNICSRKQIKYLTFIFLALLVAATLELIGLGSFPIFIMIIFPKFVRVKNKSWREKYVKVFVQTPGCN